jgi:hypothetical protein
VSLQIEDALRDGFARTFERNGLIIVGVFVAFGLANAVVSQSLSVGYTELIASQLGAGSEIGMGPGAGSGSTPGSGVGGMIPGLGGTDATPLALPIPVPVAVALSVAFAVTAEFLRIVAIRVFASAETERIPRELLTRKAVFTTLNGVVGGLVVGAAVLLGTLLLIVPGLFLAVSFYLVRQVIAVEDANFVDAIVRAWELSKGNRLALFGLLVIVWFAGLIVGLPATVALVVSSTVSVLLSAVIGGFVTTFGIAVATRAFVQIRDAAEAGPGTSTDGLDAPV